MSNEQKRKIVLIVSALLIGILSSLGFYRANEDKAENEIINGAVNEIKNNIPHSYRDCKI